MLSIAMVTKIQAPARSMAVASDPASNSSSYRYFFMVSSIRPLVEVWPAEFNSGGYEPGESDSVVGDPFPSLVLNQF